MTIHFVEISQTLTNPLANEYNSHETKSNRLQFSSNSEMKETNFETKFILRIFIPKY